MPGSIAIRFPRYITALLWGVALTAAPASAQAVWYVDLDAPGASTGQSWADEDVAGALACGTATVARVRRRFVTEGIDEALRARTTAPGRPPKIDGVAEAHLIALACSEPPAGRARWTVRLLADRFVALGVEGGWLGEAVSRETVRQALKETRSTPTA